MPAVVKAHDDWCTKLKTRDLNDWLKMAVERHPPPAVNGHRVRPKYMAQIKARPPTFVLFASRAEKLPESYKRYSGQLDPRKFRTARHADPHQRQVRQEPLCRRDRRSGQEVPGEATRACGPPIREIDDLVRQVPGSAHPASSTTSGPIISGAASVSLSSPGKASARILVRMAPGLSRMARIVELSTSSAQHRTSASRPGLGRRVGAPEGSRTLSRAGGQEDRPRRVAGAEQGFQRADQTEHGGQVGGEDLVPQHRRDMRHRVEDRPASRRRGPGCPAGRGAAKSHSPAGRRRRCRTGPSEPSVAGSSPRERIASSSSSSAPWVRPTAMTCAPASASASAEAWPIPRVAPVTRAIAAGERPMAASLKRPPGSSAGARPGRCGLAASSRSSSRVG